jgi:hypothetical protein
MPTPPTLGTPEQQAELQRYMRELRSFDWSFDFSDDWNHVKRTQTRLCELRQLQRRVDPTGEIWLQFMPKDCRHTPTVHQEKANG